MARQKWEKPPLSFTRGSSIRGSKLDRNLEASFELSRIASSKTTPAKKELFSKILKNSNYFNNEQINKISDILSKRDDQTRLELHKILYSTKNNEVLNALTKRKLLSFKPRKVEWMLINNYNNVAKAFVNELHKSDFFMNQIENALKTPQPLQATVQEQPQSKTKGKKRKTKPASGKNFVYNIKNYGTVYGGVGKNVGGGSYTFTSEKQAAEQANYQKIMEGILAYNKNLAEHLKTLKEELGKPVERPKGGFEFVSSTKGKQAEKPAGRAEKTREPEQLELALKEKLDEKQLNLNFNTGIKAGELEKQIKSGDYSKLKELYDLNSISAREKFEKIAFEKETSDDRLEAEVLELLLNKKDFNGVKKAVLSENWGVLKGEALSNIGLTVNNENKDEAVELFSSMLKGEYVDENYLRVHESMDKIEDKKTREYIFNKLKPDLLRAEELMKKKSAENKILTENDLKDFFKPSESASNEKTRVSSEPDSSNDFMKLLEKLDDTLKKEKK